MCTKQKRAADSELEPSHSLLSFSMLQRNRAIVSVAAVLAFAPTLHVSSVRLHRKMLKVRQRQRREWSCSRFQIRNIFVLQWTRAQHQQEKGAINQLTTNAALRRAQSMSRHRGVSSEM
jgi:hypothetical protein